MKYDDATWHTNLAPDETERERWAVAAAHIGLYLKWCLQQGWAGELHLEEPGSGEDLEKVRAAEMTGSAFLEDHCDFKLTDEDLSEEGNAFSAYYYDKYLCDLDTSAPKAEEQYAPEKVRTLLDSKYEEWIEPARPL